MWNAMVATIDPTTAASLDAFALHSLLAIHGRNAFLQKLKSLGVQRIGDRQKICNSLTADGRAGELPSPSAGRLQEMLCAEPTTLRLHPSQRCRIFVLDRLRADQPFNGGEALEAALQGSGVGVAPNAE